MRAWGTVIQRDLQVQAVIADMLRRAGPVTYTTFLAYDEVAHHSGVERPETLLTLRRVDREHRRASPPPPTRRRRGRTELVVLSDHGQSPGRDVPRPLRRSRSRTLVRDAAGPEAVALERARTTRRRATSAPR